MRKVIYGGAMSLDGFIAGPNGEYDWIVMDPDIDFAAFMGRFDTFLIGRKTFEAMRRMGETAPPTPGIQNIVFSRTLRPADCPNATLSDDAETFVADLRKKPGKDIALFGGGELFRSLLAAGLVDEVELRGDSRSARRGDSDAAVAGRTRQAQAEGAPGLPEDRHGQPRVRGRHRVTAPVNLSASSPTIRVERA